ncbi:MAG TPA: SPOR domain-containing protein [Gemmatimonadaceae bacterium]|nr:SPOR domain-containing protein [Gemmatimonadaceae bacterium]
MIHLGRLMTAAMAFAALTTTTARPLRAQADTSTQQVAGPDTAAARRGAAIDSAFARARAMVISGQAAAGRSMGDSILAATREGTEAYGRALYGQAMLAPTATDAALDYQRIIVEYPLSAHAGDALLQLAQLERSQGDRASAIGHLQRFLRENPASPERARTGLWLAQLLFEQRSDQTACGILATARSATAPGDVELQNQMNFYASRCATAAANAAADSVARADSVKAAAAARAEKRARARARETPARETSARKTAPAPAPASAGRYAVQLAAYATRAEAEKLVATLHARGIEARVDGDRKPFRVRAGRYKTHAEATKAAARFKALGYAGFVTGADGR